jgi:hypothetical protein
VQHKPAEHKEEPLEELGAQVAEVVEGVRRL